MNKNLFVEQSRRRRRNISSGLAVRFMPAIPKWVWAGIFVLLFIPLWQMAQTSKAALQSRKAKLEKELEETNKDLEETQKNKTANLRQLVLINKKISQREALIREIDQEISGMDTQVEYLGDTITRINTQIESLKNEYARLVNATFRNRSAGDRLMFIFSSGSFNQAFKRIKYLQQYTEYRKKQVDAINQSQQILTTKKTELETQKATKLTLKTRQEKEKGALSTEKKMQDQKVKTLTAQEKKLLDKLHNYQAALNNLQRNIEALVAAEMKKAREEKARRDALAANAAKAKEASGNASGKAAAPTKPAAAKTTAEKSSNTSALANTSNYSMSVTAEDVALTGNFEANRGRLPAPVDAGVIVSTFGEHAHPEFQNIKIKNNGIDISTSSGANAKAVFGGEVSSVFFIQNFHYTVIIRHGDYLSVYSNLQSVSVKKGDKVKIRQALGSIAVADGETRPRLHFELWRGTTLLNPLSWTNL